MKSNAMRIFLLAAVSAGLLMPVSAEAGVRTFFQPLADGARVDACLGSGNCGKPAADAFCKTAGYDKALNFERQIFSATRALDSGKLCASGNCTAFKQVKCFTTKSDLAALTP